MPTPTTKDSTVEALLKLFSDAISSDNELGVFLFANGKVSIADLAAHSAVSAVTDSEEVVRVAAGSFDLFHVDGDVITPRKHKEQYTLTLLEVPAGTTEHSLRQAFEQATCTDGSPCPKPIGIRFEDYIGIWILNFASEPEVRLAMGAGKRIVISGILLRPRLRFNGGHHNHQHNRHHNNVQYMQPSYPGPYGYGYPPQMMMPFMYPPNVNMMPGQAPFMVPVNPPFYPNYAMDPAYMQHPQQPYGGGYYSNYRPKYNNNRYSNNNSRSFGGQGPSNHRQNRSYGRPAGEQDASGNPTTPEVDNESNGAAPVSAESTDAVDAEPQITAAVAHEQPESHIEAAEPAQSEEEKLGDAAAQDDAEGNQGEHRFRSNRGDKDGRPRTANTTARLRAPTSGAVGNGSSTNNRASASRNKEGASAVKGRRDAPKKEGEEKRETRPPKPIVKLSMEVDFPMLGDSVGKTSPVPRAPASNYASALKKAGGEVEVEAHAPVPAVPVRISAEVAVPAPPAPAVAAAAPAAAPHVSAPAVATVAGHPQDKGQEFTGADDAQGKRSFVDALRTKK